MLKENEIVKIARALSDKTRVRIIKEIACKGSISCGEAERIAELSQPTVSHHLKILTDAGILNAEKNGRHITVTVNKHVLEEFASAIAGEALQK
ncbi:MAG: metalloregulator ArsR/SmtB family transcription factor [Ignavibacteriaceae bacterium]|nr:metalloregulator ArsR/SmtB family transcription factor [Ignavibacteriaceae bacterium]